MNDYKELGGHLVKLIPSTVIVSKVTASKVTVGGDGRSQLSTVMALKNVVIALGGIDIRISG